MEIVLGVILFLLGASVGSFLNVVADRMALGKSIVSPPSHCPECGHRLESGDLVPVFSYLVLRGKCRYCKAGIPVRSLVVEVLAGLLYVQAFVSFGVGWMLLEALVFISVFVLLSITDMENRVLPHRIVYPSIGLALAIAGANSFSGLSPDILRSLLGLALGGGFMLLLWALPRLFHRRYLGFGDVGMGGLIGAALGFPLVTIALYLAILIGGLSTGIMLALRVRGPSYPVRFGLFMGLGAIITILWEKELSVILAYLWPL